MSPRSAALHRLSGEVVGFALTRVATGPSALWITGDTVLYEGVREAARRLTVDTALLHVGAVRFPVTGPLRYTMTAEEAIELCHMLRPRVAIPIHYEGWSHFRQGREETEKAFASGPADIRERVRWLPLGTAAELA